MSDLIEKIESELVKLQIPYSLDRIYKDVIVNDGDFHTCYVHVVSQEELNSPNPVISVMFLGSEHYYSTGVEKENMPPIGSRGPARRSDLKKLEG